MPQRQCYTAPENFGRDPKVTVVQLEKGVPALFFSAAGGGVSGFPIHPADFVWGPEESHYVEHRYIISTYVFGLSREVDRYYLQDRYMTVHKYDLDAKIAILAAEKQEILARLRRVKAETERRKATPR